MLDTGTDRYDYHPHKPTPIVVDEEDHSLVLEESHPHHDRQTVVDSTHRPLYDLLMEVLHGADAHCPDFMPAALSRFSTLVQVRQIVSSPERGSVNLPGYGSYGLSYCRAVRDAIDEWRDRPPIRLVAVGCSASKYDIDERVPAKELYRGSYWSCKREYAETIGDDWAIISARHDILDPDTEIDYYERSVDDLEHVPVQSDFRLPTGHRVQTALDQWAARVYNGISRWIIYDCYHGSVDPRDVELEILLGRSYRDPLEARGVFDRLRGHASLDVSFPFQEEPEAKGGNGNQMSWMKGAVEAATEGGSA